ncbi:hypothetical protein [Paenibacillus donghaensis]|uniref:Uncharacterized protein n=1 Tax=Paenibacillus donghaensis TaxID=414771 RepID=A0A2Z2K7E0_9BACL|nr:hypothetical protein [Paenibacillus donghaensis]ASA22346.1 hypothetical protein B9T62_17075 [Paenibacillus donghaensis]
MKAPVKKKLTHPISRLDADDSRLLKKEFLRLIRVRLSIVRTLCESDQMALELVQAGATQKEEGFESDIEALIWKFVVMRLEARLKKGATQ